MARIYGTTPSKFSIAPARKGCAYKVGPYQL